MQIEDLEIYKLSMDFADKIWNMVNTWNHFEKDTIGKQWVRSSDSIAANISEGFGRYTPKDSKNFYIIARGSIQESKTWLTKAFRRKLISEVEYKEILDDWNNIHFKMIYFIQKHSRLMENK